MLEIYRRALFKSEKWFGSDMNRGYCKKTLIRNIAAICALYGKPKMIFRLWIGLMQIQLKMCGPSLRESFNESVYSL